MKTANCIFWTFLIFQMKLLDDFEPSTNSQMQFPHNALTSRQTSFLGVKSKEIVKANVAPTVIV